jgi:hypothetical protein
MSFATDVKRTWKESISYCKWSELRLLLLASLSTFIRSCILLIKNFWWLFVLDVGIVSFVKHDLYSSYVRDCFDILILFLFFLTVRASTECKNAGYYFKLALSFWGFFCGYLFLFKWLSFGHYGYIVLKPLIGFSIFFFWDSDFSPKSLVWALINGVRMFVYFLPIVLGLSIVWYAGIREILFTLMRFVGIVLAVPYEATGDVCILSQAGILMELGYLGLMFICLMFLSALITLYIKIKHHHCRLFFKTSCTC